MIFERQLAGSWMVAMVLGSGGAAFSQLKPDPINEDMLVEALRKRLDTDELIRYIRNRGVDFLMTAANRKLFLDAGASPKLIETAEDSIRNQVCRLTEARAPEMKCPEPPKEPPFVATDGAPLLKREVTLLLQARVPVERIEKIVEKRGVEFANTSQTAREIRAAGGTAELNGIISENQRGQKFAPIPEPPPPTPAAATVAQSAPPPSAPAKAGGPVAVAWSVQQTRALRKPQIVWPIEAQRLGIFGAVSVRVVIAADGKTKQVVPIRSAHDSLTRAVVDGLRKVEYRPTVINGRPVEVETQVDFNFYPSKK